MKRWGRVDGSVRNAVVSVVPGPARAALSRRCVQALAALASLMLASCVTPPVSAGNAGDQKRGAPSRLLSPMLTLTGARVAPTVDRTGTPQPFSGAAPFAFFVHPVAASASGNDLYIADSGAGRVFRFDFTINVMAHAQAAPAGPGTKLAVASDFSLYVLDQSRRRVLKIGRNGQLLAEYADALNLNRPIALAVDDTRGLVFVADALYHHLVVFHPLGGAAQVVHLRGDERNRVMSITAMALAQDTIHISDALCRCVAVVARDGAVRATYGHQQIGQPGAIAIDRHDRVFVADVFNNSVKVFSAGRLIDDISASALGLLEVSDLTVSEYRLVVTDGAGARVAVLRIAPWRQRE